MFKYYREQKMSQRQLHEETGIPLRTIQAYESGALNINGAKLETICKIALALNIPAYLVVDDPKLKKLMMQERNIK